MKKFEEVPKLKSIEELLNLPLSELLETYQKEHLLCEMTFEQGKELMEKVIKEYPKSGCDPKLSIGLVASIGARLGMLDLKRYDLETLSTEQEFIKELSKELEKE